MGSKESCRLNENGGNQGKATAYCRVPPCKPPRRLLPVHTGNALAYAMGSKNSAYAGASGAHHLARRPDSVFIGCEMRKAATTRLSNPHISGWERGVGVLGESVHGVAPDAQHRARLVGAEYRVGGYDGPHLSPANALGHGRSRAPFVSRLPRVPGRERLPGRSPPSFSAAPRLDVGVHGRPRNQELPAEPVRVDLSRPDEVVRLASARPHVLLHLDHRHPLVAAPVALGRGAFRRVRHGCLQSFRAMRLRGSACVFVFATIEPLMAVGAHGGSGDGSRWVELVEPSRNSHEPRALALG